MTHTCTIEVAEPYVDAAGKQRARWARKGTDDFTPELASQRARELRQQYGAARIACPAFEVVALRQSFGLKLIEGTP